MRPARAASARSRPTPLALFPVVILLSASAAVLGVDRDREAPVATDGPFYAASAWALAPYRALREEVVEGYATRYRVEDRLAELIYDTAIDEGVEVELAFRLVRTESSFHPMAVGPAGAIGLAQVRPSTARWLDSTVTRERLFEAETNLRLGFRYLRMLLDMHDHDTRLALLAYNRGPGTVAALLALGEDPGNGYASRVMGWPHVRNVAVEPPSLAATRSGGSTGTAPPAASTGTRSTPSGAQEGAS